MSDDQPASCDYRTSHLNRGEDYDNTLARNRFDAYMAEVERRHLLEIVPRLFPGGVSRYLDFACGTARITQTVAPFAEEAIGVDISPSMLEEARRKCPKVTFVQADLTSETNDLGSFDLATAFRFFGNAQPTLREEALDVLNRLVRPGGYLITNNHRNPYSLAALLHRATGGGTKEKDLSHFLLVDLLAKHRFRTIETRPIAVYMYRSRHMRQSPGRRQQGPQARTHVRPQVPCADRSGHDHRRAAARLIGAAPEDLLLVRLPSK